MKIRWLLMVTLLTFTTSCTLYASHEMSGDTNEIMLRDTKVKWAFTQEKDAPEEQLIQLIRSAETSLETAIYSITHPDIVKAIKDAHKRGVSVRIITDRIQSSGRTQSEALKILKNAGIPVLVNANGGLMHLKMTVADRRVVATGSYNYSGNASTVNDEVLLILYNDELATRFNEAFDRMWNDGQKYKEYVPASTASEQKGSTDSGTKSSAACTDPTIKGNISSGGEKIYHVSSGRYYKQTEAEMMFCSEEEAKKAGFRASKQ